MSFLHPYWLLLFAILELQVAETSGDILSSVDSSFCHGRLEVIYPELHIDKCLIVQKNGELREKLSSVWKAPEVFFSDAREENMYVLLMVDPDAPSRTKPTSAPWRHWLVSNIKAKELKKGNIKGTVLTEYHPPTPPRETGFHRYQFLLFEQPHQIAISLSDEEKRSRGKWDLPAFIARFNLGEPVAALQFLTQNFKD